MEAIRTIQDFKDFMNANYNNIYSNAIKAEELTLEDEWMYGGRIFLLKIVIL